MPISPQNAQWNVIKDYNDKHKDQPIELTSAESFQVSDAYAWVLENRYDAYFDIKLSFEKAVTDKDGAYHQYADKLTWFLIKEFQPIHSSIEIVRTKSFQKNILRLSRN